MSERKRQFLERLKDTGESGVRESLELGRYGADHIGWAKIWLADIDQERSRLATAALDELMRSQAAAALDAAESSRLQVEASKEANRIASDANAIASEARDKAQTANTIATIAMIVSVISAVIMIVLAFVQAARS